MQRLIAEQRTQHKAELQTLQKTQQLRIQQSERDCRIRLEKEFAQALETAKAEAAEGKEAEQRRLRLERLLQESRLQVQELVKAAQDHVAQSEILLSAIEAAKKVQSEASLLWFLR